MHFTSAALIAACFSIHQASATGGSYGSGGWGDHTSYSTPANTNNKCNTNQTKGYDWSDLSTGSFSNYGSNTFSGWSCSNSFGKRDLLTKRTFQSKCITGKLDDEPAVDCNGDDKMSIKTYQVSSDQDDDVDIECHYTMPDDSRCKEVHTCASSGSTITNTQCGGAKKVTFKPYGSSKGKGCNIGVHSIEFDCETASVPPSYSTTSTSASSYTQPTSYSLSSSVSSAISTSIPGYGTTSSETLSATQSAPTYGSSSSASVPVYSSSSSVETSPASPSAPVYSSPSSVETSPVTASSYSASTLPGYANSSTIHVPSYGSSSSSTQASSVPVETPSYSKPECPDVLPTCINSWLHLTTCKDNTDYECFCKNSDLVSNVYNCVSAWSDSDDTTNSGAGYFMGLCAKYIPENPAVVTGCPSTIKPATGYTPASSTPNSPVSGQPSSYTGKTVTQYSTIVATITSCGADATNCPAASAYTSAIATSVHSQPVQSASSTPAPAVPCTTITYSSTWVVPATYSTGSSQGATVPSSSSTTTYITTVTVPQVAITTYTVTESGSTVNVPGLVYQPPSSTDASPVGSSSSGAAPAPYITTAASSPVSPAGSTSLGTTYVPKPSSSITPYLGAGQKLEVGSIVIVGLGAFAGVLLF